MEAMTAPVSSGADQPYWDGLVEGRVVMPQCAGCGLWHWPAVWRCGACGSWEQVWRPVQPVGRIYTWTRTRHPFGGLEQIGIPFVSLVVEIDGVGGRRLTGLLEGDEAALRIGARVCGRIATTPFGDRQIPALRWAIEDGAAA